MRCNRSARREPSASTPILRSAGHPLMRVSAHRATKTHTPAPPGVMLLRKTSSAPMTTQPSSDAPSKDGERGAQHRKCVETGPKGQFAGSHHWHGPDPSGDYLAHDDFTKDTTKATAVFVLRRFGSARLEFHLGLSSITLHGSRPPNTSVGNTMDLLRRQAGPCTVCGICSSCGRLCLVECVATLESSAIG